jgi:hypothetical protein
MAMNRQNDSAKFDYGRSAELFPGRNPRLRSRAPRYMRFDSVADAVRFAIERLPADVILGTHLEVDGKRYDSAGIRGLYMQPDFPLPRLAKVA